MSINDSDEYRKGVVWHKAQIEAPYDKNIYRKDAFGRWMKWSEYGNRSSQFGWEIDHIHPISRGGRDTLDNLQALHWESNLKKSDRPLMRIF